jgi:hypothetical protein
MNLQGNMKWVLLIGGVLLCAVCFFAVSGGNLLQGNPSVPPVAQPSNDVPPVAIPNNPQSNVQLSQIVMTRTVGEGNEPIDTTNQFRTTDRAIYAVAQGNIPSGTRMFARWSREGVPFEDTTEIVADRAYENTFIEFHISPSGSALVPGNYNVQFFVNGNPGPQAQFLVS